MKHQSAYRFIFKVFCVLVISCTLFIENINAQANPKQKRTELEKAFLNPPQSAKPWVIWYWMQAAVSKEGITADLEAMKENGIGGAYLMTIKDTTNPPMYTPVVRQLTPIWWEMIAHAMKEAQRLGLKIGMHVSDGFALAGGPWITPELSMQKVVWTKMHIKGGRLFSDTLSQPETLENYYQDIAVFAFPSLPGAGVTSYTIRPKVTSSKGDSVAKLLLDPKNTRNFVCDDACWIQYEFNEPFTCRSIIIHSKNNFQSNRFIISVSDDGKNFRRVTRLEPPRTGWQDGDADYTHAIPETTAKYFRFEFDKTGTEPGAEDLDAAKWKPTMRVYGIELSSEPAIQNIEGKSGEVWRISKRTSNDLLPGRNCIAKKDIIDLTLKYKNGKLEWNVPNGNWTILRIGHTSTGYKNATAGGGKGLECDKFNPLAIKLQFDNWFGEVFKHVDKKVTDEVLKVFHIDSWECGSQNWSPVFREEFKKRRGYDLYDYLPAMAGVPIDNADATEKFLHDVRETVAQLIVDKFYGTLAKHVKEKGCTFVAESVAPTMLSDGMAHYDKVDIPMGEFWLRSPTHDKPNDMLDAISGAHIYRKNIVQAEAFTQLRTMWDEHPGMLKKIQDRNYALGINRMVYHVFMHNPWMDRKPGMTLDGIGLFFQRDQTWWKQAKAWMEYTTRCQALLQLGKPVVDIAIFTGEELPRRAVLPDRLVEFLPGIFGKDIVDREKKRLENAGQPLRQIPQGVSHSANMADPEDWIDPLKGYSYDSYNMDALIRLSTVNAGKINSQYRLLIVPGSTKMNPGGDLPSLEVGIKLNQIIKAGSKVLLTGVFDDNSTTPFKKINPNYFTGIYQNPTFETIGIPKDIDIRDLNGNYVKNIAWTHRISSGFDIYFLSNQNDSSRIINFSFRVSGKLPELWDPLTGEIQNAKEWKNINGRTEVTLKLEASQSIFVVFQKEFNVRTASAGKNWLNFKIVKTLNGSWTIKFDTAMGGPLQPVKMEQLKSWSENDDPLVRYYSGTASYSKSFEWTPKKSYGKIFIDLGDVANIAEVKLNGINCGISWIAPYRLDITKAIRAGKNELVVEVTNTWANRIVGDKLLPEDKRRTSTNAPYRLEGKALLKAGLSGEVRIIEEVQ